VTPTSCGPGCAVQATIPGPGTYTFSVSASDGDQTSATKACSVSFSCGGGTCSG
jgi:hypothetical protein